MREKREEGRIEGGVDVEIRVRKPRKRRLTKTRKPAKTRKGRKSKSKRATGGPRAKKRS